MRSFEVTDTRVIEGLSEEASQWIVSDYDLEMLLKAWAELYAEELGASLVSIATLSMPIALEARVFTISSKSKSKISVRPLQTVDNQEKGFHDSDKWKFSPSVTYNLNKTLNCLVLAKDGNSSGKNYSVMLKEGSFTELTGDVQLVELPTTNCIQDCTYILFEETRITTSDLWIQLSGNVNITIREKSRRGAGGNVGDTNLSLSIQDIFSKLQKLKGLNQLSDELLVLLNEFERDDSGMPRIRITETEIKVIRRYIKPIQISDVRRLIESEMQLLNACYKECFRNHLYLDQFFSKNIRFNKAYVEQRIVSVREKTSDVNCMSSHEVLFPSKSDQVRRVVLTGPLGLGKSTLAKAILNQSMCSDSVLAQQFDWVFIINARNLTKKYRYPSIESGYQFQDILIRECFPRALRLLFSSFEQKQKTFWYECLKSVVYGTSIIGKSADTTVQKSARALIIVDGFDEIVPLDQLIDAFKDLLKSPCLLVTTRSQNTHELEARYAFTPDDVYELKGLTLDGGIRYIGNYFEKTPNSGDKESFIETIKRGRTSHIMHHPIMLEMLCVSWCYFRSREFDSVNPANISTLYNNILLALSLRYLEKTRSESDNHELSPSQILSACAGELQFFERLSMASVLDELGAFKYLNSYDHVGKVIDIIRESPCDDISSNAIGVANKIIRFGLFSCSNATFSKDLSDLYHFVHESVSDYFAAKFLCSFLQFKTKSAKGNISAFHRNLQSSDPKVQSVLDFIKESKNNTRILPVFHFMKYIFIDGADLKSLGLLCELVGVERLPLDLVKVKKLLQELSMVNYTFKMEEVIGTNSLLLSCKSSTISSRAVTRALVRLIDALKSDLEDNLIKNVHFVEDENDDLLRITAPSTEILRLIRSSLLEVAPYLVVPFDDGFKPLVQEKNSPNGSKGDAQIAHPDLTLSSQTESTGSNCSLL